MEMNNEMKCGFCYNIFAHVHPPRCGRRDCEVCAGRAPVTITNIPGALRFARREVPLPDAPRSDSHKTNDDAPGWANSDDGEDNPFYD